MVLFLLEILILLLIPLFLAVVHPNSDSQSLFGSETHGRVFGLYRSVEEFGSKWKVSYLSFGSTQTLFLNVPFSDFQ